MKIDQLRRYHEKRQNRNAMIIVLAGFLVFLAGIFIGGQVGTLLSGSVFAALLVFLRFMRLFELDFHKPRSRPKILDEE